MKSTQYTVKFLSFAVSSLMLTSCFVVTELDRFTMMKRGSTNYDDFDFGLKALKSHVNERFEFRIIDSDNVVQCRGVVEPVDSANFELTVANAVPKVKPPYRLDFYAEHDKNGVYDYAAVGDTDHSWRVEPLADYPSGTADDGVYTVAYEHNTSFTDLNYWPRNNPTANPPKDTGADATIRMRNIPHEAIGKLFEARVVDHGTGHTVGFFRVPLLSATEFEVKIAGVVDAGVDYDVSVYIDANGNRTYENPSDSGSDLDKGWRDTTSSDATGFIKTLDLSSLPSNVDVGTAYPAQTLK